MLQPVVCSGGVTVAAHMSRLNARIARSSRLCLPMTTIFVDTNFLLHAKPLRDIPWETRHERPTVRIVRTNVRELDRHKDLHPKKHLRERALKALQVIERSTQQKILRHDVDLVVDNRGPQLDFDQFELDANSLDDLLIASVLEYRAEHPNETIVLYTHDVGPRLTAQRLGIDARPIPADDLLPPQKDDAERENERLKRELHELRAAAPQLSVTMNGETEVVTVTTLVAGVADLSDDDVNEQAAAARAKLPAFERTAEAALHPGFERINGKLVLDLDRTPSEIDYDAIAAGEYDRYERACVRYEKEYAAYLRERRDVLEARSRTIAIQLDLHNSGGRPGDDIRVELEFPSHIVVELEPPVAPVSEPVKPPPPRTIRESIAQSVSAFAGVQPFAPRFDPLSRIDLFSSGPTLDGNVVSWWFKSLNHGFVNPLGKLYLMCRDPLRPFDVSCSIHAANAVKPFTATIVIKPIIRTTQDE